MYIKVHVTTGVKKELIIKRNSDTYDILVREPAERNLANRRILEIVANELGVAYDSVRIVSGHHSPSKILSIIKKP